MRIGFVQMNCLFGDVDANLSKANELTKGKSVDLLVLPELFNTGYYFKDRAESTMLAEEIPNGQTTRFLVQLAFDRNCFIVAGLAEKSGGNIFNSSVLVSPTGHLATYRKIHLYNLEKKWFDPGDKPFFVMDIGPCKIGMMICFDWIFPESMRTLSLLGADVICHPTNLVMPYCQKATVTRCLENNVFSITANRIGSDKRPFGEIGFTGQSQITAPFGKILASAPENKELVKVVEIDVQEARNKNLNPHNDLIADRRPEMYNL